MRRSGNLALVTIGQFLTVIKDQPIGYTLKISPQARQARLEFRDETGLVVVLPRWAGRAAADELLWNHQRWVAARLSESDKRRHSAGRGEGILLYLGDECTLCVMGTANRSAVAVDDHRLMVAVGPGEDAAAVVEKWYRQQAVILVGRKAAQFAPQLGVTYQRLTVRDGRTSWASCSPKARISFNWKLMMVPPAVVDYVVIHELAHIRQMNHSDRFWRFVEAHCPEWRTHRRWLRDHQSVLDMPLRLTPR